MTERSDAWYRSILPNIGALTDVTPSSWVYLAMFECPTSGRTRGVWLDLPGDQAVTRAEALVVGQDLVRKNPAERVTDWDLAEEWVYTTEEAHGAQFQQSIDNVMKRLVDDDCGCGGSAT